MFDEFHLCSCRYKPYGIIINIDGMYKCQCYGTYDESVSELAWCRESTGDPLDLGSVNYAGSVYFNKDNIMRSEVYCHNPNNTG